MSPLRPVLVAGPTAKAIEIADVKAAAEVDHADRDVLFAIYADAAIARLDGLDGILGRCLIRQTWAQAFHGWGKFRLPFPDVVEGSVAITYRDAAGVPQVVAPADFYVERELGRPDAIEFVGGFVWPALDPTGAPPITVTFSAGFGATSAEIPAGLRAALIMDAVALIDGRDGSAEPGPNYDRLIAPHRLKRAL